MRPIRRGAGGSITRTWPITDPLGSGAAQVNSANVALQINAYDEYGVPQAGHAGPFGYAGALYTPEVPAAPWHMRNRQYHPGLGRFLQTDPIGVAGGINLYAYTAQPDLDDADTHNGLNPAGPQRCLPRRHVAKRRSVRVAWRKRPSRGVFTG